MEEVEVVLRPHPPPLLLLAPKEEGSNKMRRLLRSLTSSRPLRATAPPRGEDIIPLPASSCLLGKMPTPTFPTAASLTPPC